MRYILPFILITFPQLVFGQDTGGLVTCSGPDCNFCTFMTMVDRIINWLFGFLIIVAVLMLVYAGFKLVASQGNSGAMTAAKGMVTNVIIGFVIMMSAWLVVDTIMKGLARTDQGAPIDIGMWNQISASSCAAPVHYNPNQNTCLNSMAECQSNNEQAKAAGYTVSSCIQQTNGSTAQYCYLTQ